MAMSNPNHKRSWHSTLSVAIWSSLLLSPPVAQAQNTPSLSRWGQAITYIPSPPSILLHGGNSDTSNSFSYTSAPNSDDTLSLPLSSGFAASSSSGTITLDAPDSPAYAWHTLTPFSTTDGNWDILSFGGDGGPSEAIQTRPDSVWYLTLDAEGRKANWKRQAEGWGNQPARRIYHSAVGGGGKVYITGGLRNDGSGTSYSEVYEFDPAKGFTDLPPLPRATYHHSSFLLPNGTLVVLGGVAIDMATGMPSTRLLSTIATLDTGNPSATWAETIIPGVAPQSRRAMASALSEDGKTIFIHGGASTTFTEVYADAWTLDVETLAWTEVGQSAVRRHVARQEVAGPGGRYDHSAIVAPGGQVIILGGYGGDSVTDPGPFVFDLPEGSWQSEYTPTPLAQQSIGPSGADSTTTPTGAASAAVSGTANAQSTPVSTPIDASASQASAASVTSSSLTPSSSTSDSPKKAISGMSLPAQLGLIFGILAVAGMGIAVFIWRYRRRRRHQRLERAIYGLGPAQPPSRPYGSRAKGGEGLMEEARNLNEKPTPPLPPPTPSQKEVGLGLGAITATFASIRGYVTKPAGNETDAYAVLHDEGAATPARKPTRKVGQGIRLIGPRSPPEPRQSIASIMSPDSRRDMLSDEDDRKFPREVQDWEVGDLGQGQGGWKSAKSILADHEEDPFEDDDDDDSLHPPIIRGGPVPTPHESTANLDPFDDDRRSPGDDSRDIGDYGLPRVESGPRLDLDLDALLPGPLASMHKRYSAMSSESHPSTAMTDIEEGVIQHAHFASPGTTASLLSPAESTYQPIKRTDTFFRRMAAGGISSLLPSSSKSLSRSQSSSTSLFDIRDPAPPPSLWPVVSRDILTHAEAGLAGHSSAGGAGVAAMAGVTKPPTAWRGGAGNLSIDTASAQRPTHHPGPSLTSITSARSMRDMVIVQREPTSSSGESATIEDAPYQLGYGQHQHGQLQDRDTSNDDDNRSERSDDRNVKPKGTPGGGLVVFDGADFASPNSTTSVVDTPKPEVTTGPASTTPLRNDIHHLEPLDPPLSSRTMLAPTTPSSSASASTSTSTSTPTTTSTRTPRVPSGSPIPQPLLSHRRPVSEMVKSINKRGSGSGLGAGGAGSGSGSSNASPLSLFSPVSQYSPASPSRGTPGPSPGPPNLGAVLTAGAGVGYRPSGLKRPTTLYEAVKRDKLQVANPDGRR